MGYRQTGSWRYILLVTNKKVAIIDLHISQLSIRIREFYYRFYWAVMHKHGDITKKDWRFRRRREVINRGSEKWTTPWHVWVPWLAPEPAPLSPWHTSNMGILSSAAACREFQGVVSAMSLINTDPSPRDPSSWALEKRRRFLWEKEEWRRDWKLQLITAEKTHPTIQTIIPTMETRRDRKAKGRPSRKPSGLQSPSQHIFF